MPRGMTPGPKGCWQAHCLNTHLEVHKGAHLHPTCPPHLAAQAHYLDTHLEMHKAAHLHPQLIHPLCSAIHPATWLRTYLLRIPFARPHSTTLTLPPHTHTQRSARHPHHVLWPPPLHVVHRAGLACRQRRRRRRGGRCRCRSACRQAR
eukprot:100591-Chlamydomonas_euryale.AAC.1